MLAILTYLLAATAAASHVKPRRRALPGVPVKRRLMKPNMPASTADSTPRPPNGRGDARQAAAARAAHAQSFGTMESSLSVCWTPRLSRATFAVPWKNPRARPNRINASRLQGGDAMAPRRQHSRCEFSHRGGICEHGSKVQPPRCRESVPCAPALKRRKCRQKRRRKLHPFAGRLITGSWPSSSSQLYNAIDTSSDVNWRAKSRSGARAGRDMAGRKPPAWLVARHGHSCQKHQPRALSHASPTPLPCRATCTNPPLLVNRSQVN